MVMLLGIFQLSRIIIITIFEYIYYSTNLPKSRVQMVMVTMMMIMAMMMMMMMRMLMMMMSVMMMKIMMCDRCTWCCGTGSWPESPSTASTSGGEMTRA